MVMTIGIADYKANTYVTFHETDGSYLLEKYPDKGFDRLDYQDHAHGSIQSKKIDSEPQNDGDYAADFVTDKSMENRLPVMLQLELRY